MTSQWSHVSASSSGAMQAVKTLQNNLIPIINVTKTMLELAETTLEIAAKFIIGLDDIQTTLLKAAIAAVRETLKAFGTAGCYILPVATRELKDTTTDDTPRLFMPDPSLPETAPPVAFLPALGRDGGNYGFYRDIVSSLYDQDDVLRPQLSNDAYVAGVVLVAGSDLYAKLLPFLLQLAKLLSGTKPGSVGTELVPFDFPHPKNLTAEFVPAVVSPLAAIKNRLAGTGAAVKPYAAKLRWKLDDSVIVQENAPGGPITYTVTSVWVTRSTSPITPDMPSSEILASNTTGPIEMLAEFEHEGWVNEFYDETIELGVRYWYAVSYIVTSRQTEVGVAHSTEIVTRYEAVFPAIVSVFVPTEINTVPRSGTPPDWMLLPSPLALIPSLTNLVDQVNVFLNALEKRLDNSSKKFKEYVDAVKKDVQLYIDLANEITTTIQRLLALMAVPQVYFGAYTFSGKGGNALIESELGKAFSPSDDPGRPPFDQGTEALAGLVILVGSEQMGALKPFTTLTEFLLGSPTTESAWKLAMDSVGGVLEETERQVNFLSNLDENTIPADTTPPPALPAIGPNLEPAAEQNNGEEN